MEADVTPVQALLSHLDGRDWLKAHTIGAFRWNGIVNGTAPATRSVVVSNTHQASGGAAAVTGTVEVPFISHAEIEEILAVAKQHGLRPDPALVAAAVAA